MPFERNFLEDKPFTTKGFSVQKLLTMARFLPRCSGKSLVICQAKYKNKKREKEELKNAIKISIMARKCNLGQHCSIHMDHITYINTNKMKIFYIKKSYLTVSKRFSTSFVSIKINTLNLNQ